MIFRTGSKVQQI